MPLDPTHMHESDLAPGVREEIERVVADRTDHKVRRYVVNACVGFAILFGGVLWNSIEQRNNRQALAENARLVVRAGCIRDFHTIASLRIIVIRGQGTLREAHDAGVISDELYHKGVDQNKRALEDLKLPDCTDAEKKIPVK